MSLLLLSSETTSGGDTGDIVEPAPGPIARCGVGLQLALGGGSFVTVTSDVRAQDRIIAEYGIRGSDPTDRVAQPGEMSWLMNNGAWNSGAQLGYYSVLRSDKRAGFQLNIPARLALMFGGVTYYKWRGLLEQATPDPGVHESRVVKCRAADWFQVAMTTDAPDLEAQTDTASDDLFEMLLDGMDTPPVARDIEVGVETFAWAFDGGTGQQLKVRERIIQICASEFGYCYPVGDQSAGGTVRFESRLHRSKNPDVLFTLTSDDLERPSGVQVPGSVDDIYRSVKVFVYPTQVDASPTTVLFELQNTSTLVQPGENFNKLFGPYRDPDTNDQIGGTEQIDPVATTDYTMNSQQDGGGSDLTGNFTVVASFTGEGVRFTTIQNNGTQAAYITSLKVRGKAVRRTEVLLESTVPGSYGDRSLTLYMPFQNNTNVGADVVTYLTSILSNPFARAPFVRFMAKTDRLMTAALEREPGDRIEVSEEVTGLSSAFTINGVRLEVDGMGHVWCQWWLEPASAVTYWIWPPVWDETTIFGF